MDFLHWNSPQGVIKNTLPFAAAIEVGCCSYDIFFSSRRANYSTPMQRRKTRAPPNCPSGSRSRLVTGRHFINIFSVLVENYFAVILSLDFSCAKFCSDYCIICWIRTWHRSFLTSKFNYGRSQSSDYYFFIVKISIFCAESSPWLPWQPMLWYCPLWSYGGLLWYDIVCTIPLMHNISHRICTPFYQALFCDCYIMQGSSWFVWFIYTYSSGLLHWHWGNHMIAPVPVK